MRERKLLVQRLGLLDYESALALQKQTEQAVKTGAQPDTLLLLEHPHTLTIGRRGDSSSILLDEEQLKQSLEKVAVYLRIRGLISDETQRKVDHETQPFRRMQVLIIQVKQTWKNN